MKVEIKNRHILDLYIKGKSKKYRLSDDIVKKFFMRIQQLEASNSIYDLWKTPSLNFESIKGYENRYSVRIERKWRIEMEIVWENEEKTIGEINILDISKHYGE